MRNSNDQELITFFLEQNWPEKLLDDLRYLHSLNRDEFCLNLKDPYTIFPIDPEEWYGILVKYGYFAFGSCPNGDFVALDCTKDTGSVVYISHEEFHYDPSSTEDISHITRPVARSIMKLIEGLNTDSVPLDYYE
jgi:hypothetical protein